MLPRIPAAPDGDKPQRPALQQASHRVLQVALTGSGGIRAPRQHSRGVERRAVGWRKHRFGLGNRVSIEQPKEGCIHRGIARTDQAREVDLPRRQHDARRPAKIDGVADG